MSQKVSQKQFLLILGKTIALGSLLFSFASQAQFCPPNYQIGGAGINPLPNPTTGFTDTSGKIVSIATYPDANDTVGSSQLIVTSQSLAGPTIGYIYLAGIKVVGGFNPGSLSSTVGPDYLVSTNLESSTTTGVQALVLKSRGGKVGRLTFQTPVTLSPGGNTTEFTSDGHIYAFTTYASPDGSSGFLYKGANNFTNTASTETSSNGFKCYGLAQDKGFTRATAITGGFRPDGSGGPELNPLTAKGTIDWEPFVFTTAPGQLSPIIYEYRIFRGLKYATATALVGSVPVLRPDGSNNRLTFTDTNLTPGTAYFYKIVPYDNNGVPYTVSNGTVYRLIAPPQHMVFVARGTLNGDMCRSLGLSILKDRYNSCVFPGWGNDGLGYLDYGSDFLVDIYELGCAVEPTAQNIANGRGNECWPVGFSPDMRFMTAAQMAAAVSNRPLLQPLWKEAAVMASACKAQTVSIMGISSLAGTATNIQKKMPSMKVMRAMMGFDPALTPSQYSLVEQARAGEGKCNSAAPDIPNYVPSAESLPYNYNIKSVFFRTGAAETRACVSRYGLRDVIGNMDEVVTDMVQMESKYLPGTQQFDYNWATGIRSTLDTTNADIASMIIHRYGHNPRFPPTVETNVDYMLSATNPSYYLGTPPPIDSGLLPLAFSRVLGIPLSRLATFRDHAPYDFPVTDAISFFSKDINFMVPRMAVPPMLTDLNAIPKNIVNLTVGGSITGGWGNGRWTTRVLGLGSYGPQYGTRCLAPVPN